MSPQLPIKALASQTGLSPHTIRAWERRYGALTPGRTDTNRRLYSQEDVERLLSLKAALEAGHSIGRIATLSLSELKELSPASRQPAPKQHGGTFLDECIAATVRLDGALLEALLVRAAAVLGIEAMIEAVVLPLIHHLDAEWQNGGIRIAHEHLASATLRTYLERVRLSIPPPPLAPRLLVTTPAGQIHELGALIVSILAAMNGWQVIYLGPNLPADEIADAASQSGAAAVALSIVYPVDDPALAAEIDRLRQRLSPRTQILVGGRAVPHYEEAIKRAGGIRVDDMHDLKRALDLVRGRAA